MSEARRAPRLLLGVTSLEGPTRATRDRQLEVAARFRESESLAVTLVKAIEAGADAVWAAPSAALAGALADLKQRIPVIARLPETPTEEDLHHDSFLTVPAGARPGTRARGSNLPFTLFAGDLAARVAQRIEQELPALAPANVTGVGVAAPITDLALAAGHRRFFERVLATTRSRVPGPVGFETANLGLLLERLREWRTAPDFVLGPVNPAGLAMKPSPETVLAELATATVPVVACDLRAGGLVELAVGAAFARAQGARGLLAELVDLDDVRDELKALLATN